MRIWVTRARPAAEETAERLRALGHTPVVDPVLAVRPVDAAVDLAGVDVLVFTSRNGLDIFAGLTPRRDLMVLTVGDRTAQAAIDAGFHDVQSAGGDVSDLAELVEEARTEAPNVVFLHVSGREVAGELPGVRRLVVYETVEAGAGAALADLARIGAVLVHSPKAARRIAALLEGVPASHLRFLCISENTARPLRDAGHEKAQIAAFPEEAALLKLLDR